MSPKQILVALGWLALTAAAPVFSAAAPDPYQRQVMRITDHAWLLYNNPRCTQPPFEGNVVAAIRTMSRKPVRFLLYTRYHGDHDQGAGAFLRAWPGVVIVSSEATRANMTGAPIVYIKTYARDYQGMVDYGAAQSKHAKLPPEVRREWQHVVDIGPAMVASYEGLRAYPARLVYRDSISLPDDEVPLEIAFLGKANTDGDVVLWAPRQRVLATGDIVVHSIPYASASYPGSWLGVIDKLKAYAFAFLVPGHGSIQTDRNYLDKLQAAILDIKMQVEPLAAKGESLNEVRKAMQFSRQQDEFAGNNAWNRSQMRGFFLEAKGEPIVQGRDGG